MTQLALLEVESIARGESRRLQLQQIAGSARLAATPEPRRATIIGCLLFVLIVLACVAMRWFDVMAASECRSSPVPLLFGANMDAAITTGSGVPCPVSVRGVSAAIYDLEIVSPPRHGAVVERGRTGLAYRSHPNFRGEDSFAFALRGQSDLGSGTAFIWVAVTVK